MSVDNTFSSATPCPLISDFSVGDGVFTGSVTLSSSNSVLSTPSGSLLGFYGVTPVSRSVTTIGTVAMATLGSADVSSSSTFGGYKISQVVAALISCGILGTAAA